MTRALTADDILNALERAGQRIIHGAGYYLTNCVLHDDRRPSLSFGQGHDGGAFIRCHSGCPTADVVAALRQMGATGTAPTLDPVELARRRVERDMAALRKEEWVREIHAASLRHPRRQLELEVIASALRWDVNDLLRRGVGWDDGRVVIPIAGDDDVVRSLDLYAAPGTRARELVSKDNPKLKALGRRSLWPAPPTVAGTPLLLVEGAPCAATLLGCGFAAVAFPSASGLQPIDAPRFHSSSPVLVLADADEVGRRAARSSAFALRDAGVFARAIDLFPSRTDGFDVADALREHDKRSDATDWLMNRLAPFVKEG